MVGNIIKRSIADINCVIICNLVFPVFVLLWLVEKLIIAIIDMLFIVTLTKYLRVAKHMSQLFIRV